MLGGLDWAGIETVADVLGVTDIEMLVHELVLIRDWLRVKEARDRAQNLDI